MIDSHCHFDFPQFDCDRESLWRKANALGVEQLLVPATEFRGFEKIQRLAAQNPHIYYALGLHPWFLKAESLALLPGLQRRFRGSLADPKLIAIGETGLDFAISVPAELQEKSFLSHLELASQHAMPVIVHHRKSHNRIIQILKQFPGVKGVIHAFSGSAFEAQTYADMGFVLGIGGTITYQRSLKTKQAIKAVGLQHLLLETDAPAMPISGKQGQRNSPEYLPQILFALADVLQQQPSDIEQVTNANFYRIFERANQNAFEQPAQT